MHSTKKTVPFDLHDVHPRLLPLGVFGPFHPAVLHYAATPQILAPAQEDSPTAICYAESLSFTATKLCALVYSVVAEIVCHVVCLDNLWTVVLVHATCQCSHATCTLDGTWLLLKRSQACYD